MSEKKYLSANFRLGELTEQIKERCESETSDSTEVNEICKRDLARYYAVIQLAQQRLAKIFTEPEQKLICDSLNGTWHEPVIFGATKFNVEDSIRFNKLDQKWKINGANLLEKISSLSPFEELALIDAVESFWKKEKQSVFPGKII